MIGPKSLHAQVEHPAEMQLSVYVEALGFAKQSEIVDCGCYASIAGGKRFLANCERAFVKRLGLSELTFIPVKLRQIIHGDGHVRMLRAQSLFLDRNGAGVKLLRVVVTVHRAIEFSEKVEWRCHCGAAWSRRFLLHRERAVQQVL